MCSINSVMRCLCIYCIFCSVLVFYVVLAVLVTIGTKFLSSISLPFYHSLYTILVSSLPLPSCFNCVLWNGFDSSKEIDWYPVLFPFFSASFFFFYSPSFSQPLYDGWVQCIDHCRTNHCQTGRFSSFSVYSTFEIVCRNTLKPHQETPRTGLQLCTVREDRHAT
jgi:hypothetical protein